MAATTAAQVAASIPKIATTTKKPKKRKPKRVSAKTQNGKRY